MRLCSLAVFASLLTACVGPWPDDQVVDTDTPTGLLALEDVRLGFVYVSSQNDGGWTQTHHDAAVAVAEDLDVPLSYVPSVDGADAGAAIAQLVDENDANVIYTTSTGYITGTLNAANDYPDRYFFSCCGKVDGPNLTSYFGRIYQPIYVLGFVAGKMSCTGRIGVVAALPLPEFVRHINAFTLGARAANPDIEVDVRWVGGFFDPPVETALTLDLIANGSDVILGQTDSTSPLQAAAGQTTTCDVDGTVTNVPIFRVGYHSPTACEANPEQCLSSAHWNWEALYRRQILSLTDGTYDPSQTGWQPMENSVSSVVDHAPFAPFVPQTIVQQSIELKEAAIADPQVPFIGPLADNTGAPQIAEGQRLSDEELERMCWFVDGVISTESGAATPGVVPLSCGGI